MKNVEKTARLARLLVAACLLVGVVPAVAGAAARTFNIMTVAGASVTEGDSGSTALDFTVTLSQVPTTKVTAKWATSDGTATAGSDYDTATGTVAFNAGETSKTVSVNVLGDTVSENNETFLVTLSGAKGAKIRNGPATGTITNDDAIPEVTIDDISVAEGDSGTTSGNFTLSLSGPSGLPVTVQYLTANGTATSPADYSAASGSATFAAGETSKQVPVSVVGDLLDEGNEDFKLKLQNPSGATLGRSEGVATAVDDDFTPTISINDVTVTELASGTDTVALFTVTLSGPSSEAVSVDYTTTDGTATLTGGDYDMAAGTLNFAPGGALTQQLPVTVNGDDVAEEPNETFTLNLSNPTNAVLGTPTFGTAKVNDDDPTPQVTINDVTVNEGDNPTTATFTLTMSNAAASDVTVGMATSDGSADAGQDYTAKTQDVVIPAGQQSAQFTVDVTGDQIDENSQTFHVTGSMTGQPAAFDDAVGTATILDDDAPPMLTVDNVSVVEGDKRTSCGSAKQAVFTFSLSNPSEKVVGVSWVTTNGTATFKGADYCKVTSATAEFAPGDTTYSGEFSTVAIMGDRTFERNETLSIVLSNPNEVLIADGTGQATIVNNDIVMSLGVRKTQSKVKSTGFVRPPHPGVRMQVKYFKKTASGSWKRLRTKRPTLSAAKDFTGDGKKESKWAAAFPRRSGGSCKLVARFPGDAGHHRAGTIKKVFSC